MERFGVQAQPLLVQLLICGSSSFVGIRVLPEVVCVWSTELFVENHAERHSQKFLISESFFDYTERLFLFQPTPSAIIDKTREEDVRHAVGIFLEPVQHLPVPVLTADFPPLYVVQPRNTASIPSASRLDWRKIRSSIHTR